MLPGTTIKGNAVIDLQHEELTTKLLEDFKAKLLNTFKIDKHNVLYIAITMIHEISTGT